MLIIDGKKNEVQDKKSNKTKTFEDLKKLLQLFNAVRYFRNWQNYLCLGFDLTDLYFWRLMAPIRALCLTSLNWFKVFGKAYLNSYSELGSIL